MKPLKQFGKTLLIQGIKLWLSTLRFHPKTLVLQEPAVIAFWHKDLLPMWRYFKHRHYFALVSRSKDGRKLGELLQSLNYQVIYGSSSRGGIEALQEMIEAAKTRCVLLTPDGPKGPKEKMKPGALLTAQFADVPIYLIKAKYFGIPMWLSWDRAKVPLPFAKIQIRCSSPIHVKTDLSDEQIQSMIERCEKQFQAL